MHVSNRPRVLAEGVLEAGWLAAAALTPLFFNVYTFRSFEPDKAVLIRSLALAMLLAWLVKTAGEISGRRSRGAGEQGSRRVFSPAPWPLRTSAPLLSWAAVIFGAVYLIATLTSAAPGLSLWGSYQRAQGVLTTAGYLIIFGLTLFHLRSPQQIDRLVSALLLTSLVVALYGWFQQLGWDVITWKAEFGQRITSTQGNPIFVGAFLIMVIPLTVARLAQIVDAERERRGDAGTWGRGGTLSVATSSSLLTSVSIFRLAAYAILLILQIGCVYFTLSRGPFLGMLAGLIFFALLIAVAWLGRRGGLITSILVGLGLLVLSGSFLLPQSPLGRVATALDPSRGTARERALAWGGTIDMVTADPLRTLIGYGPDSMLVTFPRYFPEELAPLPSVANIAFDRAHNEILDTLATTGILGVLAYLLVVGMMFWAGLKVLGITGNGRSRRVFVSTLVVGVIVGGLVPRLFEGSWRYAGLGITLGLLLGLVVYVIAQSVDQTKRSLASDMWLAAALLGGLVAHLVELQFGIGIVSTRTTFWLFAALLAVMAASSGATVVSVPAVAGKSGRGKRRRRQVQAVSRQQEISQQDEGLATPEHQLAWAMLVGLVLATLAFDFIPSPRSGLSTHGISVLLLMFGVWVLGITFLPGFENFEQTIQHLSVYSFFSLGWFLLFASIYLVMGRVIGIDGVGLTLFFMLQLLAGLGMLAVALVRSQLDSEKGLTKSWAGRYLVTGLVGATLIFMATFFLGLNAILADVYHKQAQAYSEASQTDDALRSYQAALSLAPRQDVYYIYLAGVLVRKAQGTQDPEARTGWLRQAEAGLERGRSLNPLASDYSSKLGLLYRIWGDLTPDPETRQALWTRSADAYRQASALNPQNAQIHREWGDVARVLGDWPTAAGHYSRAATLNPQTLEYHLLLGDALLALGDTQNATVAYRNALTLNVDAAFKAKQNIVNTSPDDYIAHRNLAFLYYLAGRTDAATAEADKARDLAPESEKAAVERVLAEALH